MLLAIASCYSGSASDQMLGQNLHVICSSSLCKPEFQAHACLHRSFQILHEVAGITHLHLATPL